MATNTKIEWAHHTFNPWIGCTKVSAGCANCYAESLMDKRYRKVEWGPNGTRVRTKQPWRDVRKWYREAGETGERFRIFCASLADIAEDRDELIPWRADLCDVIRDTADRLDWLLLSKRPENYTRQFPDDVLRLCWVGTSVEDQAAADARIPHLLRCPAAVRFLSCEPLLGAINFLETPTAIEAWEADAEQDPHGSFDFDPWHDSDLDELGWIIFGCESNGKRASRFADGYVDAARNAINQSRDAGVPVFHKQMPINGRVSHNMDEWPDDLRVRELPTKERSNVSE